MHSLLLFLAACGAAASPATTPTGLEYKDAAAFEGRAVAQYQAIDLRDTSIRPLEIDAKEALPSGVKYGFLQLGPNKDTAMVVVWVPKASDGAWVQLFSNADGKPIGGRHKLSGKTLELPVKITAAVKPSEVCIDRTLLFKISSKGDGLRYAVRGYAQGKIKIGEKDCAVLLVDGNGDALLDTVGRDRLWIDLDGNKRFDSLTEQFPLGKAIFLKNDVFVVRSDPLASAVVVNQRNVGEGKLKLTLAAKHPASSKISAELVTDIGEYVSIEKLDEFVAVPCGEFCVARVSLEVPDESGKTWSCRFYAQGSKEYSVAKDGETTIELMKTFEMKADIAPENVNPGGTIRVMPNLVADSTLELSGCSIGKSGEGKAEVLLIGPDGKQLHRSVDGFG